MCGSPLISSSEVKAANSKVTMSLMRRATAAAAERRPKRGKTKVKVKVKVNVTREVTEEDEEEEDDDSGDDDDLHTELMGLREDEEEEEEEEDAWTDEEDQDDWISSDLEVSWRSGRRSLRVRPRILVALRRGGGSDVRSGRGSSSASKGSSQGRRTSSRRKRSKRISKRHSAPPPPPPLSPLPLSALAVASAGPLVSDSSNNIPKSPAVPRPRSAAAAKSPKPQSKQQPQRPPPPHLGGLNRRGLLAAEPRAPLQRAAERLRRRSDLRRLRVSENEGGRGGRGGPSSAAPLWRRCLCWGPLPLLREPRFQRRRFWAEPERGRFCYKRTGLKAACCEVERASESIVSNSGK